MEEIAEGAFKGILRFIRYILIEGICEFLLFWMGRIFLLLITLGRYPRGTKAEEHEGYIVCVGIAVVITAVILISLYV